MKKTDHEGVDWINLSLDRDQVNVKEKLKTEMPTEAWVPLSLDYQICFRQSSTLQCD
jgi:hypothetical protein